MKPLHTLHIDTADAGKLIQGGFWYINIYEPEYHCINHLFHITCGKLQVGDTKIVVMTKPFRFFQLTEMHTIAAYDLLIPEGRARMKNEFPTLEQSTVIAFAYYQFKKRNPEALHFLFNQHKIALGLANKTSALSLF